jgi:hypothetical protein
MQNKDTLKLPSPENKHQLNTTPIQSITKLHFPSEINGISQKHITYTPIIPQQILREENTETCASCSNNLATHKSTCIACCLQFHVSCMNSYEDMCYSCLVTTQQLFQQGDNSPDLIELTAGREKSNELSSSIARNFKILNLIFRQFFTFIVNPVLIQTNN